MDEKTSATDGAEEFEASGPITPAPSPETEPTAEAKPEVKAEAQPKFDPAAGQRTIYPTADEMRDTFEAQAKAAAEHHLRQLAMAHPEVAALIAERDALKAQLAKKKK